MAVSPGRAQDAASGQSAARVVKRTRRGWVVSTVEIAGIKHADHHRAALEVEKLLRSSPLRRVDSSLHDQLAAAGQSKGGRARACRAVPMLKENAALVSLIVPPLSV